MSDLIKREEVLKKLNYEMKYGAVIDQCGLDTAYDIIENIPSAELKERTAKVVSDDIIITVNGYRYHYDEYLCNACKKKVFSYDSYCSHCGAKLDWSGNEQFD